MAMRQSFESWEPPCISVTKEHCFVGDSGVCVNCHLIKRRSLRKVGAKRKSGNRLLPPLLEKQGGLCFYCGVELWVGTVGRKRELSPRVATVEHIVPTSRGGTNQERNLVAACRRCNSNKGDLLLSEWLQALQSGSYCLGYTNETRAKVILRVAAIIESR